MKDHPRQINRIATPVRNAAQRFAYIGLVVAAFGLMLLGKADAVLVERIRSYVTDGVAPILDVVSRPMASISNVAREFDELVNLRDENKRLRLENQRLLQWQSVARRLDSENQSFRGLLNYVPAPQASFISARVIADTGGAFAHTLVLNAGRQAGVLKGQAVMTGEGLFGRVSSVGSRSSRVLLIADLNSRIPVLVEQSRTRAILAGNNTDRPLLIHLPPGSQANPGDRIVTSGHGGAFPPGLPVGIVSSVSEGRITVQPFVTRDRLEYVRVLEYGLKGILPASRPATPGAASKGDSSR